MREQIDQSPVAWVLTLFDHFCHHTGNAEAHVSTAVFNHGQRIKFLRNGASLRTTSVARALQWFSDHWPSDLPWPETAPRPAPVSHPPGPIISRAERIADRRSGLPEPYVIARLARVIRPRTIARAFDVDLDHVHRAIEVAATEERLRALR